MKADALRGNLELVILAALRERPLHGYAIIKRFHEQSGGEFDILEGTLYPALHRLEQASLVKSHWDTGSGRRRRLYELTRKGRKELASQGDEWRALVRLIDAVIGDTP